MKVAIRDIKVGARVRKDMGDVAALAESIKSLGLLQPVVVDEDHVLLAGHRRLKAVAMLEWEEIPVHVVKGLNEALPRLLAERDENTCREPFRPSELVALSVQLEAMERPRAEERKKSGKGDDGSGGRGKKKNLVTKNHDEIVAASQEIDS